MNIFFEQHIQTLKALLKHQVEFLLIGGYAVVAHGYRRTTGDMDLWIKPCNQNKLILCNALQELQFDPLDINTVKNLDFTNHIVFSIGDEPEKVDFITHVNLVKFQEASTRKQTVLLDGISVPIVHLNDLVLMKINTGRAKDTSDIEELQRIHKSNNL